jgi:hypothetical protein
LENYKNQVINLRVVQAEFGNCFILDSSEVKNSVIFIRGGPYKTFKICSKPTIQKIVLITKLGYMLLTHIDNDGIIRLIELMEVIKNQREMVIYLIEFN